MAHSRARTAVRAADTAELDRWDGSVDPSVARDIGYTILRERHRVRDAVAASAAEELPDEFATHLGHPDLGDLDTGSGDYQSD